MTIQEFIRGSFLLILGIMGAETLLKNFVKSDRYPQNRKNSKIHISKIQIKKTVEVTVPSF